MYKRWFCIQSLDTLSQINSTTSIRLAHHYPHHATIFIFAVVGYSFGATPNILSARCRLTLNESDPFFQTAPAVW
jgi:hypothetical protein